MSMATIALLGQPNSGKSTLFNALTGLHQHVGNWPGKTVEKKEGSFAYKGATYDVADLPGSYNIRALITLRRLSMALVRRTKGNYVKILSFNSFLILMGALGLFQPTLTALLHNSSTIVISLKSMTDLLDR